MKQRKGSRLKDSESLIKPQIEKRWAQLQPNIKHHTTVKD